MAAVENADQHVIDMNRILKLATEILKGTWI